MQFGHPAFRATASRSILLRVIQSSFVAGCFILLFLFFLFKHAEQSLRTHCRHQHVPFPIHRPSFFPVFPQLTLLIFGTAFWACATWRVLMQIKSTFTTQCKPTAHESLAAMNVFPK